MVEEVACLYHSVEVVGACGEERSPMIVIVVIVKGEIPKKLRRLEKAEDGICDQAISGVAILL